MCQDALLRLKFAILNIYYTLSNRVYAMFAGIKRLRHEAKHSPPCSGEVKSE